MQDADAVQHAQSACSSRDLCLYPTRYVSNYCNCLPSLDFDRVLGATKSLLENYIQCYFYQRNSPKLPAIQYYWNLYNTLFFHLCQTGNGTTKLWNSIALRVDICTGDIVNLKTSLFLTLAEIFDGVIMTVQNICYGSLLVLTLYGLVVSVRRSVSLPWYVCSYTFNILQWAWLTAIYTHSTRIRESGSLWKPDQGWCMNAQTHLQICINMDACKNYQHMLYALPCIQAGLPSFPMFHTE